jgi:L-iditol 2-dehydrogenase
MNKGYLKESWPALWWADHATRHRPSVFADYLKKGSTMRAAYLTDICKIELAEAPSPGPPGEAEVLLAVEVVGLCGSDMHYYRTGRIGELAVEYPFVVGHELAGRVVEVGASVKNLSPGQRVAVDPLVWCGQCDQCLAGRQHTCRNQKFLGCPGQMPGCLQEQIIMPAASCVPVPDSMTAEAAAIIEPMSIGLYTQRLGGDIAGKTVGILGAGPIGLCTLAACRGAGVEQVYMTDIRPGRVEFAKKFGASWLGNPRETDIVGEISSLQPLGLDVVFECAGMQETVDQAVDLLRPGGRLVLVGIPEAERLSVVISHARRKELSIQNVRRQNHCIVPAIEMLATGLVDIEAMITHRYDLAEIAQAFETVANYKDGVIKAMVRLAR